MPGARESSNGNPDVTWETATKQNYGVDIRFFDDRLSFGADFFWEDRKVRKGQKSVSSSVSKIWLTRA